jgi:hypothetical protein
MDHSVKLMPARPIFPLICAGEFRKMLKIRAIYRVKTEMEA